MTPHFRYLTINYNLSRPVTSEHHSRSLQGPLTGWWLDDKDLARLQEKVSAMDKRNEDLVLT